MSSPPITGSSSAEKVSLEVEVASLRLRLLEAEETLAALQGGEVDAIVVGGRVFTLGTVDAASNRLRGDALAQMEDAVVASDNQHRVIYLNPAAERQYGTTSSAILGVNVDQLYLQQWLNDADGEACLAALASGGFWRGQTRHILPSGKVLQLECTLSAMHDDSGAQAGYLAVMRDVSARAKAEAALKESQARLAFALHSARIGDWSVDLESGEVVGSDLYFKILGVVRENASWHWEQFVVLSYPEDRPLLERAFRSASQRLGEFHVEYRILRPDGATRWVELHGSVFQADANADRMVGILADITDRKLAEQALRDADRRKDEFLATLAHELRNPLAPIRNASHILSNPAITPAALSRSAAIVSRQVAHMARLLDDLLDVARITRNQLILKKEYVTLQNIVATAVETARPIIDAKGHMLEVLMPADPVWIEADPVRVAQVVSNLLNNAAKYSDNGASITVGLERKSPTSCILTVTDTGIGMNAAALKSVFQMFAQEDTALERSEGGLGIGLALVKGLVELHGGTVEAFSKGVGHGSEFTVHLPAILKDAHQPVVEASTPHGETGRRVLIADDNQDAAESLSFLLELQGHHVSVVHDGLEAFEAARRMRPSIVLLDIGMPGLNGYELAQKIRQEAWGQDMALIAATGWGQDDDRMRAFAAGFDAHVTKPFDPAHLLDLVGSIQRSERRLTGRSP